MLDPRPEDFEKLKSRPLKSRPMTRDPLYVHHEMNHKQARIALEKHEGEHQKDQVAWLEPRA